MACFRFYIVRVMEVLRTAGLTRMQGAGEGGSSTLERCVSNLYVYTHTYIHISLYAYKKIPSFRDYAFIPYCVVFCAGLNLTYVIYILS